VTCSICLRPEQEAGPLADGICIDCEKKLAQPTPAPAAIVRVPDLSPLSLIEKALTLNVSADQLGKLMDLKERDDRNKAAEQFARAITGFQADMPAITKSRTAEVKYKNSDAKFSYKYASFDNVMKAARPHLERWGIALSFDTQTTEGGKRMEVTVNIRVGIHVEQRKFSIPISAGMMSDAQACGAALSYAKRYALCAALNIVVTDEDNDGAALDYISETDVAEIRRVLTKLGGTINYGAFLKYAGVEPADPKSPAWSDLAAILHVDRARIMDELQRREVAFDASPKRAT